MNQNRALLQQIDNRISFLTSQHRTATIELSQISKLIPNHPISGTKQRIRIDVISNIPQTHNSKNLGKIKVKVVSKETLYEYSDVSKVLVFNLF